MLRLILNESAGTRRNSSLHRTCSPGGDSSLLAIAQHALYGKPFLTGHFTDE